MTPAEQLLRKVARIAIDEQTGRDLGDILTRSPDWHEILHKSHRSGTGALVYHGLKQASLGHLVPPQVWARFKSDYVANGIRNLVLIAEAEAVVASLVCRGIPTIALKGMAVLNGVYPAVAMRQMSDVDLLVRPEQFERATRILVENGFVPHDKGELGEAYARDFVRQSRWRAMADGIPLELHNRLVSEKAPFDFDLDALWQRAVPIRIGKTEALALSVEDHMHHLAAHLFDHHFAPAHQWRNICDLGAIIQVHGNGGIDWNYLLLSSRQYRTTGALFLALNALDESFQTPPVKNFLVAARTAIRAIGMSRTVEALSHHLPRFDFDALSLVPGTIVDLAEEPSLLGKLRIAFANVNSKKRVIAFHGLEEAETARSRPLQALRSLALLRQYNLNSIRMAYLVGKVARETRRQPQPNPSKGRTGD